MRHLCIFYISVRAKIYVGIHMTSILEVKQIDNVYAIEFIIRIVRKMKTLHVFVVVPDIVYFVTVVGTR